MGRRKSPNKKSNVRYRPQQGVQKRRGKASGKRSGVSRSPEIAAFADSVIGLLYGRDDLMSSREISAALEFDRRQGKALRSMLTSLCRDGVLVEDDGVFGIAADAQVVSGVLSVHPKGFAFAAVAEPPAWLKIERDIFIPPSFLATASHGDLVLVAVTRIGNERAEGRVVKVLTRATNQVVGTYTTSRGNGLVLPEDERLAFKIMIRNEDSCGAKDGEAVVVEITDYRPDTGQPEGKVVEVLGDP
ncbi:MAG: hypothetical protein OEL55_02450, partial [Desulfobulbaceae bacterium]|nr:hypothetical protein [Desulfobulbaceae bacterium]